MPRNTQKRENNQNPIRISQLQAALNAQNHQIIPNHLQRRNTNKTPRTHRTVPRRSKPKTRSILSIKRSGRRR